MQNRFLKQITIQQQQQNADNKSKEKKMHSPRSMAQLSSPISLKEEIQDVAGLLVGEYYPDKEKFAKDHALVKELQKDLIELGYNLGKTGADGKLGAKTITAMHNFEQDFPDQVQTAAEVQAKIQNSVNSKKGQNR